MKLLRKICSTLTTSLFVVALLLFVTVLTAAACSNRVTMSFETFGGTKISSISTEAGKEIKIPGDPEKDGYVFLGWYLDRDCLGEAQRLPDVMPESSVTYYAKYAQYPVLTLNTEGGTLERTHYYVEEGTNLSEFLSGIEPRKDGLLFDGWTCAGKPLDENAVMTEEDLTLTARYLATYTIETRLQSADGSSYDVEKSVGYGREGERIKLTPPTYEHFTFSEELSLPLERTLQPGENAFVFTYQRERRTVHYLPGSPDGTVTGETPDTQTYYRGEFVLPDCGYAAEGYAFLGWGTSPTATEPIPSGERYTLGEEELILYALWATEHADGRGNAGKLLLSCNRNETGEQLALLSLDSGVARGSYSPQDNVLSILGTTGRIEHGFYLLSDSGTYTGYSLADDLSHARYGVLALDFETNAAQFSLDEKVLVGSYAYQFDETNQSFTGRYEFVSGEEIFLFTLRQGDGTFLKQGEEAGEYLAYDGYAADSYGDKLIFDGFGNVSFARGTDCAGAYLGTGKDGEWTVTEDSAAQTVLLRKEVKRVGETVLRQRNVFLVFDEARAGEFSGENGETLSLDGYGVLAQFAANGQSVSGSYSGEGQLVTLPESGLRFVLNGRKFTAVGEEAGYYDGARGRLFLDGTGGASFSNGAVGTYAPLPTGDWNMEIKGENFRFQTAGKTYRQFDEAIHGIFLTLGGGLDLDGYGGGTYVTVEHGSVPVRVEEADGQFEIFSETFSTLTRSLTFSVDRVNRTVTRVTAREAGKYTLSGTDAASYIRLDGAGNATLFAENGETAATGTYSCEADRGAFVLALNEEFPLYYFRFRLNENGVCAVYSEELSGTFTGGNGALVLDGYGGGIMQTQGETVSGSVRAENGKIRLDSGEITYFITLSGKQIVSAERYVRYAAPNGETLFVCGETAFFQGGKSGTLAELGGGEYSFTADGESIVLLLENGKCYFFDESVSGTYLSADGMLLVLDGYGRGTVGEESCLVLSRENNVLQLQTTGKTLFIVTDGGTFAFGTVVTELQ